MKKELTAVVAIASLALITGCGSTSIEEEVPSYAQRVTVDANITGRVVDGLFATRVQMNNTQEELEALATLQISPSVLNEVMEMHREDEEDEEIELTLDCAYEGNYTIYLKYENTRIYDLFKETTTYSVDFNQCMHDEEMIEAEGFLLLRPVEENSVVKFYYTGKVSGERTFAETEWSEEFVLDVNGENFNFSTFSNEKKIISGMIDGRSKLLFEHSNSMAERAIDVNYFFHYMRYDENGSLIVGQTIETKSLQWSEKLYRDLDEEVVMLDGYFGEMEHNLTVPEGKLIRYLYAEDYKATESREGEISTQAMNGVIGAHCLGGTVALKTVIPMETNSSQYDVEEYQGVTPFIGKIEMEGKDSQSTLTFGQTAAPDLNSYVQLTIDEEEVGDKQSLNTIRKDCTD